MRKILTNFGNLVLSYHSSKYTIHNFLSTFMSVTKQPMQLFSSHQASSHLSSSSSWKRIAVVTSAELRDSGMNYFCHVSHFVLKTSFCKRRSLYLLMSTVPSNRGTSATSFPASNFRLWTFCWFCKSNKRAAMWLKQVS